mgnify:FL=1|jgi:hypothetical protein
MKPSVLLGILLLTMPPIGVQAQTREGSSPDFPSITAQNLLGESFDLPHDLPGDIRVIFVAFRQRQQPAINTWLAVADALEADYEGLRYFEFPTISRPFRLMKPVIDNGMRSGISSDAARARTITLFTSVSRFVEAIGLPGTDDIATLLLDSEGRIRWYATGVHNLERENALRRAIETIRAGA